MESHSLMLLLSMLVSCSLFLNGETISVTARRNEKFWSSPFDRLASASKFRKQKPKKDFEFVMAFHPDDLEHAEHPMKPKLRWDDRSSTSNSRHSEPIKHVDLSVITPHTPKPPAPPKKTKLKTPQVVNEIHVQIDDMADLTDILGNSQHYQDIVLSIDQQPDTKLGGNAAPPKEKPPKPFWGPPLVTPSTERPTYYTRPTTKTIPFKKKEETSVYQSNTREHSTLDPKIVYDKQKEKSTTPEHFREQSIHMQSGPPYRPENDPFDQSFWHRVPVTEPTTFFNNPISPQSYFHQKHLDAGIVSNPHYSEGPSIILKEIDSSALASYPSSYYPPSQDHHVVYHQPAPAHNNYYHPPSGFAQVDFSPIFLAIVPIALFLGAAAAFALATATSSSSSAAAVAQQQQQQEESSNNNANNNNANSNNNIVLAALLELIQHSKHDDSHDSKIIIITTTTAAPAPAPAPAPPPLPFVAAKDVPPFNKFANQSISIPPDKPLSEEDEIITDGFDQQTVIEPPILEEEEEPEILTYDL